MRLPQSGTGTDIRLLAQIASRRQANHAFEVERAVGDDKTTGFEMMQSAASTRGFRSAGDESGTRHLPKHEILRMLALVIFGGGIGMLTVALCVVAFMGIRATVAVRAQPEEKRPSWGDVEIDPPQPTYRDEILAAVMRSERGIEFSIATGANGERIARFRAGEFLPDLQRVLAKGSGIPLMPRRSNFAASSWATGTVPPVNPAERSLLHEKRETRVYTIDKLSDFGTGLLRPSGDLRQGFNHRHLWSPDGEYLYVLSGLPQSPREHRLQRINTRNWQIDQELPLRHEISGLAWTNQGLVAVGGPAMAYHRDGTKGDRWLPLAPPGMRVENFRSGIYVLDPETLNLRSTWLSPYVRELAGTPGSDLVYVRGPTDLLFVVNVNSGELLNCYSYDAFASDAGVDTKLEDLHFLHPQLSTDATSLITHGMNNFSRGPGSSRYDMRPTLGPRSVNRFRVAGGNVVWEQSKRVGGVRSRFTRSADVGVEDDYLCFPSQQFELVARNEFYAPLARLSLPAETAVAIHSPSKTLYFCWPEWETGQLVFRTIRGTTDTEVVLSEDVEPPTVRTGHSNSRFSNEDRLHHNLWPFEMSASPDGRGAIVFTPDAAYWVEPKFGAGEAWAFEQPSPQIDAQTSHEDNRESNSIPTASEAAHLQAEMMSRCKASTILLHVPSEGQWGTSFCISKEGFLLTNSHFLGGLSLGDHVGIVVNAGTFGEREAAATVMRVDESLGVALLQAEPHPDLLPLELGNDERLAAATPLTAIGYRRVAEQETGIGRYPAARVRPGFANALRRSEGELVTIQFDGLLQPGNSGGPVVDGDGKVVAVVRSGVAELGLSFLTPVSQLDKLGWPELRPASAVSEREDQPVDFPWIARAKRATALVVLPSGRGFGSAFCVDDRGFFATNAHVIQGVRKGEPITLVLHSGEEQQQVLKAKVVRSIGKSDLALLELLDKPDELTALALAPPGDVAEQNQVAAVGFPYGDALAVRGQQFPGSSTNIARMETTTTDVLGQRAIELRTQLNPGNSGGPIVNADGQVVGVVFATKFAARKSYGVLLERLQELMFSPDLDFQPPAVIHSNRRRESVFQVRATPFLRPLEGLQLELTLKPEHGTQKSYGMEPAAEPGTYTASIPPIAEEIPDYVQASFELRRGAVAGVVPDQTIEIGAARYRLSTMSEGAFFGEQPVSGLEKLPFRFNQVLQTVDCSQAIGATIEPLHNAFVEYTLVAKQDGRDVAQVRGEIAIKNVPSRTVRKHVLLEQLTETWAEGAPDRKFPPFRVTATFEQATITGFAANPAGDTPKPASILQNELSEVRSRLLGLENVPLRIGQREIGVKLGDASKVVVEAAQEPGTREFSLATSIADVQVGEGGKCLILHLPRLRSLCVFDLRARRVRHMVPLADPNALFAAGAEKLLVVYPSLNAIQRWDLGSGKHEKTTAIGGAKSVEAIAMGSGSAGPLWMWGETSSGLKIPWLALFDIDAMEEMQLRRPLPIITSRMSPPLAASVDGSVLGSPNLALFLKAGSVEAVPVQREDSSGQYDPTWMVHPGLRGNQLFCRYMVDTRGRGFQETNVRCRVVLPTADDGYCLTFADAGSNGSRQPQVTICANTSDGLKPLVRLNCTNLRRFLAPPADALPIWKRFHLEIDSRLLIAISENQERLLLRELPEF